MYFHCKHKMDASWEMNLGNKTLDLFIVAILTLHLLGTMNDHLDAINRAMDVHSKLLQS